MGVGRVYGVYLRNDVELKRNSLDGVVLIPVGSALPDEIAQEGAQKAPDYPRGRRIVAT